MIRMGLRERKMRRREVRQSVKPLCIYGMSDKVID